MDSPGTYFISLEFDADSVDTAIALREIIAAIAPWMVDNVEILIEQVV